MLNCYCSKVHLFSLISVPGFCYSLITLDGCAVSHPHKYIRPSNTIHFFLRVPHTLMPNSRRHDYLKIRCYLNRHTQHAFRVYYFETEQLFVDYCSTITVTNLFNNCDGKQSVTCFWVGPSFVKRPAEKNSGYYIIWGEGRAEGREKNKPQTKISKLEGRKKKKKNLQTLNSFVF